MGVVERDHRTCHFEQTDLAKPLIGRTYHQPRIGARQRIGDLDADGATAAIEQLDRLAEIEGELVGTSSGEVDTVFLRMLTRLPLRSGPARDVFAVLIHEAVVDILGIRRRPRNAASRSMALIWPIAVE